jgi:hypothetical protein
VAEAMKGARARDGGKETLVYIVYMKDDTVVAPKQSAKIVH